jgi:tetratricopeptide (TPR) repeat protein
MTMTGCAYFNTFYNAREHFKKAERLEESQRDSRRDTEPVDRPLVGGSVSREYDLTIDKCNKVIQNHSGSRWVDDAVLLMGRAYLGKRQYRDALNKFVALVNDFPDTDLRNEAIYFQGYTYYRMGRIQEGEQTFAKLLEEAPDFGRRDEILSIQADALIDAGDVQGAVSVYRQILDDFDDRDRRVATLLKLGELYMTEGVFDSAYAAYEEVGRTAEKMSVRLEARERRADALVREDRYEEALSAYTEVLDLGTDLAAERVAPVRLKSANARVQLGDVDDALTVYEEVREAYPNTVHAAEATFEIGRIQELYKGDYARAIEVYDEVNQIRGTAAQSLFIGQAKARSDKLRRLVELGVTGSEVAAGGESEAETRFLMAEQFLFQEGDTVRSWAKYHEVAEEFGESPFAARARYGLAWIALRRDADADSTLARLVDVLVAHPGTPQALQVGDILIETGRDSWIPEGALAVRDSTSAAPAPIVPDEAAAGSPGSAASDSVDVRVEMPRIPGPPESREPAEAVDRGVKGRRE